MLLWLLLTWNSPLCFTFTWPFLTLCKHHDFLCFDVCLYFHLYETGNVKKKKTTMEICRFIFFQILIKIWDTLAISCIATSNFWNVHCLLPIWVRMNQSAEMCTCGQYIELCSLVLYDQIEISNLLCLFSGITLWIFFLPLFKKSFYFFNETVWLVVAYLFKMKQSDIVTHKLRGHSSDIISARYSYQVAKVQSFN